MIRCRDGNCRVYVRDGSSYAVARSEYEHVRAEWMAGHTFVTTLGVYGQPITLKLAEVQGISDLSAETLRAMDDDDRAEKQEAMLEGGD